MERRRVQGGTLRPSKVGLRGQLAFANTRGGWLVLGVTQDGERFGVSGVLDPTSCRTTSPVLHADRGEPRRHIAEHRYQHRRQVVSCSTSKRTRTVYLDGDIRRNPAQGRMTTALSSTNRAHAARRLGGSLGRRSFTRVDLDEAFHSASLKCTGSLPRDEPWLRRRAAAPRVLLRVTEGERQAPSDARSVAVRLATRRTQPDPEAGPRRSATPARRTSTRRAGSIAP